MSRSSCRQQALPVDTSRALRSQLQALSARGCNCAALGFVKNATHAGTAIAATAIGNSTAISAVRLMSAG